MGTAFSGVQDLPGFATPLIKAMTYLLSSMFALTIRLGFGPPSPKLGRRGWGMRGLVSEV